MKSLKNIFIFILPILLFACMSEPEFTHEPGDNVVPQKQLEDMIYDIHIADAIITSKIMKYKGNLVIDSLIYESIYEKYSYSKADFENTILFYTHNEMDSLNAIYDRVIVRLNIEKAEIY